MPTTIAIRACLALALLLTSLAACETVAPSLRDREFLSVAVAEGGAPKNLVPGTSVHLRFSVGDLGADAGCNRLGGTYRMEFGRLVYERGLQTAMGCGPEREAQDAWLVDFLDSDPMIRLVGDELTLDNGSIVIRLLDREVAEPDLNIVGTTWAVEGLLSQQGQTHSSLPEGTTASLRFNADGTVDVQAGCNLGGGTWKLEGAGIRIENLGLTKRACARGPAELEAAVLAVVNAASLSTDIQSDVLTLMSGENGLQLRGS